MAEAVADLNPADCKSGDSKDKDVLECAVCLQTCVHPAQLPCGHIFCFLCVKGIANQSKKCAMCRQEIPRDFIDHPKLLSTPQVEASEGFDGGFQWFYEGRNGWWQYDERTSKELETAYKTEEKTCELLIAGFLYIIDFGNMLQLRRNDPSRRRQIKRDSISISKKGVAGLRTETPVPPQNSPNSYAEIEDTTESNTPATPSNTPHSPTSGHQSPNEANDLNATLERIQYLRLNSSPAESSDAEDTDGRYTNTPRY